MEVKYNYSKVQLDAAVQFIGDHNEYFIGQYDYVRKSMLNSMQDLAEQFPDCYYRGTMGYIIMGEVVSEESMDEDDNVVLFSILVDPAVTRDKWEEDDSTYVIIEVDPNEAAARR